MVNQREASGGSKIGECRMKRAMSERKRFILLLILFVLSLVLLFYVRSNFGQDFVQNL